MVGPSINNNKGFPPSSLIRASSAGPVRKRERVNVGNTGNTTSRSITHSIDGWTQPRSLNPEQRPSSRSPEHSARKPGSNGRNTDRSDQRTERSDRSYNLFTHTMPYQTAKWARPTISTTAPLRSHLLDETINTMPKQKSWAALQAARKEMNVPHISYDINADGVVDMQDYKIAKLFDTDGNGVLDSKEQAKGRRILSEEFFESNKDNLWKYPTIDTSVPTSVLIEDLIKSRQFKKRYNALKKREWVLQMSESQNMKKVMTQPETHRGDPGITRTRSRKMLLETRKREFRDYAAAQIALNLPHCDPLGGSPSLPAFENTGDNWVFGKGKSCNYFQKSSNPSMKITLIK